MELTGREMAGAVSGLNAAHEVLRQPLGGLLPRLSELVAGLIPHAAAAELATTCAYAPFKTHGDPEITGRLSSADLAPLLSTGTPGRPWQGTLDIAGAKRPVLAVLSEATARGAVLLLIRPADDGADERPEPVEPVGEQALALIQALWDVVTSHLDRLATEAVPGAMARSRTAADTRARVIAELTEAHSAALTGLLGVLRSGALDDAAARATATDLAAQALVELRAEADRDREIAEEHLGEAFTRHADALRLLVRYSPVRLELGTPGQAVMMAADIAHTARLFGRAVLLRMLEQERLGRIHIGWQVSGSELRATVRDDGPGTLTLSELGPHRIRERLEILNGRLDIDAVPGWGTTVTAAIPLHTPEGAVRDPLAVLGERQLEVLARLARGQRNRSIAEELHISESTVKFHVANILTKLDVGTRGEASALYHSVA
jgi:DNA-binding CsgD family transcriptional regulator